MVSLPWGGRHDEKWWTFPLHVPRYSCSCVSLFIISGCRRTLLVFFLRYLRATTMLKTIICVFRRYKSVIDSLYPTKQSCPNCGMRFEDIDEQRYRRHLDWHFKENARAKDTSRGGSRPWYFAAEVLCIISGWLPPFIVLSLFLHYLLHQILFCFSAYVSASGVL